jgi:ABC-type antimicrobial peptide transport system ATPase subunit
VEPTTEVAAFNTRLEADLVVAKLAEAGIEAFVVADNLGGTFPMMQMITGGYKVMVLEAMAEEAREIAIADEDVATEGSRSSRSAIFRFLARLSPTQILGVVVLLAASIAATLYAITQGTL